MATCCSGLFWDQFRTRASRLARVVCRQLCIKRTLGMTLKVTGIAANTLAQIWLYITPLLILPPEAVWRNSSLAMD
eukprot:6196350-Pleurochrysis_carterae.AAC.5